MRFFGTKHTLLFSYALKEERSRRKKLHKINLSSLYNIIRKIIKTINECSTVTFTRETTQFPKYISNFCYSTNSKNVRKVIQSTLKGNRITRLSHDKDKLRTYRNRLIWILIVSGPQSTLRLTAR